MKRFISIVLTFLCIFTLFGCSEKTGGTDTPKYYFTAEAVKENESTYLIEVTDGENSGITVGEQAVIGMDAISQAGCPELKEGDLIRVVFDGNVMETAPLQLGEIYSIALLYTDEQN